MAHITAPRPPRARRRLEDLTPEEHIELQKLNLQVMLSVPPDALSSTSGGCDDFRYQALDRLELLHLRARSLRSDWLKDHGLSLSEALRMAIDQASCCIGRE